MLYYNQAEQQERRQMEKSRSWPSAHDWKSCIPQKGIEGSNPSFSAIKKPPFTTKNGKRGTFYTIVENDGYPKI